MLAEYAMYSSEHLWIVECSMIYYYCAYVAVAECAVCSSGCVDAVAVDDGDAHVWAVSYSVDECLAGAVCAYSRVCLVAHGECSHVVAP